MKYFKSPDGQVFGFESDGSQDDFIDPDFRPITEAKAIELANPTVSPDELLMRRRHSSALAFLAATEWFDDVHAINGDDAAPPTIASARDAAKAFIKANPPT